MEKRWSCSGSCERSVARHPLSSQRLWPVSPPLMAASFTWWAQHTSAIAARRMWPRWANENRVHAGAFAWFKMWCANCQRETESISTVMRLALFVPIVFSAWHSFLLSLGLSNLSAALSLPCADDPSRAAWRGGGGAVPVQGVYAEDGREYTAERSKRHQPGEGPAGHQTGQDYRRMRGRVGRGVRNRKSTKDGEHGEWRRLKRRIWGTESVLE